MREIPHSPVALYEVAHPFGTLIAETILASVHMRARKQAGHTGASDLIKALQNTLRGGGRPHMGNPGLNDRAVKLLTTVQVVVNSFGIYLYGEALEITFGVLRKGST